MMKQYADLDEDSEERELFMSKFLADHQNGVQLIEELFRESVWREEAVNMITCNGETKIRNIAPIAY